MRASSGHRRSGVVLLDLAFAVVLAAGLLVTLTVAKGYATRGQRELADRRSALRLAEAALTAMQTGQPAPPTNAPGSLSIDLLAPGPVAGTQWVRVRASWRHQQAQLVGCVPQGPTEARP